MYIFVYGILRQYKDRIVLPGATTAGYMYNLGPFPAVTELGGPRRIVGDILGIDQAMLDLFDTIEGVNQAHPKLGLYRREVHIIEGYSCWVYLYNGDITGYAPISDWAQHNNIRGIS
jgi:gamma-glutamylcyclotransferase (GGCT)/AIG2-like uncharacterized protein YtfP